MNKIKIINTSAVKAELEEIANELSQLPSERLCIRRGYYYYTVNNEEVSLTKKPEIIRQLCRRAYLLARQKQINNNLKNLTDNFDSRTPIQLIAELPKAYQNLPLEYFYHPSVEQWLAKPPRFNQLNPDDAIYQYQNVNYRSLSEREIAQKLTENGLLFYYDAYFNTYHAALSPDFYIKNPFNGRVYLWEFFGAFHLPKYGERMNDKMTDYAKIGFHENENLILTFNYHLRDMTMIQNLIDRIIWQV